MKDKVSYQEQEEMGLIRKRETFVPAVKHEIARKAPTYIEPYANAALPAQAITNYESTDLTRAKALLMKTNAVTAFMALLTGAVMIVTSWYPHNAHALIIFLIWVGVASLEWLAAGAFLAILDYKETPSAQNWYMMKSYVRFMRNNQEHLLRHLYPEQYDENGRRKWQ